MRLSTAFSVAVLTLSTAAIAQVGNQPVEQKVPTAENVATGDAPPTNPVVRGDSAPAANRAIANDMAPLANAAEGAPENASDRPR